MPYLMINGLTIRYLKTSLVLHSLVQVAKAVNLAKHGGNLPSPLIEVMEYITKTYLYNFDPRKPQFYIVKLGLTGVYIIFLILLKNIDCGYLLEPPR